MKFKLPVFCLFLLLSSCREEIISPDNLTENLNEPSLTRTDNSFVFSMNADNITTTIIDYTFLNTIKSNINSVIKDHSSGTLQIRIKENESNVVYSKAFNNNTNASSIINGHQPQIIVLDFNNFTGKLKITLTSTE